MGTDKMFAPNTRLSAITALNEILSSDVRPKQSIEALAVSFDRRDRAFLMELVYGVLRHRDTLDWMLAPFLRKPERLGDFTRNNLRVAAYQIHFMRVPEWAVVHESVEIEKKRPGGKVPLVNAVLRNLLRGKDAHSLPLEFDDPVTSMSVNTSHPKWLVRRWVKRFGEEDALLLARADNAVPPMIIRANTLKTTREELLDILARNGVEATPTASSPDGIRLKEVRAFSDLSFCAGLFAVQDEASQLITYMLDPRPGERILDACAAPGGKTTHIAQLMGDRGEIVAVEKNKRRIETLRRNIESLGIHSVRIINEDITEAGGMGTFDRILLDAPCSATGVIRRHPDVKYRLRAGDPGGYGTRQTALLRSVSNLLKVNGVMVYSVCSIEPEEGEHVINDFLKTAADFRIIDAVSLLRDFKQEGFFRTYPHKHDMDGFFGVSLCRKK
ncbi:MAG: 16S rRNA (cytosine(967)-C(5))-methyltransferase RsmB [Candidatus Sulfobium sp.]